MTLDMPYLLLPRGVFVSSGQGEVPVEELRSGTQITTSDGNFVTVLSASVPGDRIGVVDGTVITLLPGCLRDKIPSDALKLPSATRILLNKTVVRLSELVNSATVVTDSVDPASLCRVELAEPSMVDISGLTVVVGDATIHDGEGDRKKGLGEIRRRILNEALANGWRQVGDRRIQLSVSGAIVMPVSSSPSKVRFSFKRPSCDFNIFSAAGYAYEWLSESHDHRKLGVQVTALRADGQDVPLQAPCFGAGFYETEFCDPEPFRWTDGNGRLKFPYSVSALEIEFDGVAILLERSGERLGLR